MTITFLYPSLRVGGAQLLFVRLAYALSRYENVSVKVVDYPNGFLAKQLANNHSIEIIPFVNGIAEINYSTILITPLSNIGDIRYLIKADYTQLTILLWTIHPDNLGYALRKKWRKVFPIRKRQIYQFIKAASDNGNIIYMDSANSESVKDEIQLNFTPCYMPIPISISSASVSPRKIRRGELLNIGWLGRISKDKVYSIIKVIDEIKAFSLTNPQKINLHIIGDGSEKNKLENYLKESGINHTLVGTLLSDKLDHYIEENIDIGVAMGTSCIEFASRMIPVFLIDYSYDPFPESIKYNWLFETDNYTLGDRIEKVLDRRHTFTELLDQFEHDDELGEKCYSYILNNHDLEKIAERLYDHCKRLNKMDVTLFNLIQEAFNPFVYKLVYGIYKRFRRIITPGI